MNVRFSGAFLLWILNISIQPAFTYPNLTIEALEQSVKYVQS